MATMRSRDDETKPFRPSRRGHSEEHKNVQNKSDRIKYYSIPKMFPLRSTVILLMQARLLQSTGWYDVLEFTSLQNVCRDERIQSI